MWSRLRERLLYLWNPALYRFDKMIEMMESRSRSMKLRLKLEEEKGKAALVMPEPYKPVELRMITQEQLESLIDTTIYTMQGRKTTICVFILKNKFEIVGSSACIRPEDFNEELGRKVAYDDAFKKLWEFEAYHRQAQYADDVELARDRANIIANYPAST